ADRRDELIADLRTRTGIAVTSVDIIEIDFLRDCADLMISYDEDSPVIPPVETPDLPILTDCTKPITVPVVSSGQ
ncbi:MAG: DUF4956 domain-containing protein, partial [Methanobacteriota archaeon]